MTSKQRAKPIPCKLILDLLREDADFRWEFVANGIDSDYVIQRLGLKGKPRSQDLNYRALAMDEHEAIAFAIEEIVQGKCTTESVEKVLAIKLGERLTHDLTHHMTGGICDTPGCYMGHKTP